jgi:hypothetical protein
MDWFIILGIATAGLLLSNGFISPKDKNKYLQTDAVGCYIPAGTTASGLGITYKPASDPTVPAGTMQCIHENPNDR